MLLHCPLHAHLEIFAKQLKETTMFDFPTGLVWGMEHSDDSENSNLFTKHFIKVHIMHTPSVVY